MRELTEQEVEDVSGGLSIEETGTTLMAIGIAGAATGVGASVGAFAFGMGLALTIGGAYYQM